MAATPAAEPAAGTVRVRIGVIVDEAGRWRAAGDYRYDDECAVSVAAENMPGENEATRIGFVTCDFPLPQPTEIPGTVESENG